MNSTKIVRRFFTALLCATLLITFLIPSSFIPSVEASSASATDRLVKQLKSQIKALRKQLAIAKRPPQIPPPFITMVKVGHPGNPVDPEDGDSVTDGIQNFGAVPYEYQIGKYEVTLEQYTAFLNAVAATDTYNLYSTNMANDANIAGIQRFGFSGSFTYVVMGSGKRPVAYVSWFDAARFCNWLHQGRPTGPQHASTTEMGAYSLNGATSGLLFFRNPGAKFWIPTEDEWYKAAYHHPQTAGGPSDHYYAYPTSSDTVPGNAVGTLLNQANHRTPNGYFSVTQNDTQNITSNYLTDAGAYSGSASFYGTFDQGGNLWERNDSVLTENHRGLRGGAWNTNEPYLRFLARTVVLPQDEYNDVGFRIASP